MKHAAMVLGGARRVWSDLAELERLVGGPWPGLVVAVNDVGVTWRRDLDIWCSLHGARLVLNDTRGDRRGKRCWVQRRLDAGLSAPRLIATQQKHDRADEQCRPNFVVPIQRNGGSSGLYGVDVAEAYLQDQLGVPVAAQRIVCVGIPMDPSPHFAESQVHRAGRPWTGCAGHVKVWAKQSHKLKHVRSMSGNTRRILGAPTIEWLEETP